MALSVTGRVKAVHPAVQAVATLEAHPAALGVVREHKIVLYPKIAPAHWFALPEHVKIRNRIRLVSMTLTVWETKLVLRELAKNPNHVPPLPIARET